MDKFINRKTLIESVNKEYQGCMNGFYAKPSDFVQIIEDSPVTTSTGERHGHWKRINILFSMLSLYKCSECGVVNERTYFCSFCGANMKGE
jgi:hypothetical protein